ncbi:helix-turn-helix transcriptional regulator [Reichenbachiella sp.]|uniref:helix-turn-helix transcriptional regulator n=1 Tax=Reichenbachiella sp. TaxID=2184521 RepID=UPI003BB0C1FE
MHVEFRQNGKVIETFQRRGADLQAGMDMSELKSALVEQVKAGFEKMVVGHKEVLTFQDVLMYTGLSESKLYKLTSLGEIPYFKPTGGKLFFRRDELIDWLLTTRTDNRVERESEKILARIRKP